MSNTAVVKVYGSSKKQDLLAIIPVYGEGMAQPDEVLLDFAEFQLRRRWPADKLGVCHFKVERKYTPKPGYLPHCDRTSADAISPVEQDGDVHRLTDSPPGDWAEMQNGSL